jgi:sugar lactone lactonase YvrE
MNTILQKVQQPWIKPGTVTGEGPLYTSDAKLLFVDIGEKRLFRVDTKQESPRLESYDVPELPR